MSDLATREQLRQAARRSSPFPGIAIPTVLRAEKRAAVRARGPGYVGHELMVPNPATITRSPWRDNAQALVRNGDGIELLSNVCRHRQAVMLDGRGIDAQHRLPDPSLDL